MAIIGSIGRPEFPNIIMIIIMVGGNQFRKNILRHGVTNSKIIDFEHSNCFQFEGVYQYRGLIFMFNSESKHAHAGTRSVFVRF